MLKEIKGFIIRDDLITTDAATLAPIYEISDIGLTYSVNKQHFYSTVDSRYTLYVFKTVVGFSLDQYQADAIIKLVFSFSQYLATTVYTHKQQIINAFTAEYNMHSGEGSVVNLNYNSVISYQGVKAPDYLTFETQGVLCTIWLSDSSFKTFYPEYDIQLVFPFTTFSEDIVVPAQMIQGITKFKLPEFNARIESNKNSIPTTYTKILNIPYNIPSTTTKLDCYIAFNIYGSQGNYDHVLKLHLYNHLVKILGIDSTIIQNIFPTLLNVNEFFIVPRWDNIAIPSHVGGGAISSQILSTYNCTYDTPKFIKIYNNADAYLKANTYNVPYDYNNIMLQITNGMYSDKALQDFKTYYSDLITVTSTHADYSRMHSRTQRLVAMLEHMLVVTDVKDSTELFNNIIANTKYVFTIIGRAGVTYVALQFEEHQYYIIPRYEFESIVNKE